MTWHWVEIDRVVSVLISNHVVFGWIPPSPNLRLGLQNVFVFICNICRQNLSIRNRMRNLSASNFTNSVKNATNHCIESLLVELTLDHFSWRRVYRRGLQSFYGDLVKSTSGRLWRQCRLANFFLHLHLEMSTLVQRIFVALIWNIKTPVSRSWADEQRMPDSWSS